MNHLRRRVQISSLRHHDAGRPAGEFGGLVKIRRRDRERAQVGDEPLLKTQGIAAAALGLADADLGHRCMGKMGGHPHHGDAARYQLRRAPAAGALGLKRERQDRGALATNGLQRDPLPIRAPSAFEPVRRLSRPTDERPQRDQKRKAAAFCRRINPRNENGCDRRVRPHPPPRRSGGPPGCLHPGGPAPIFFDHGRAQPCSPDDADEHASNGGPRPCGPRR